MDPLFQKAKQMYPNASDEEINQSLMKIRQEAPDASDDEIIQSAQAIQDSQQSGEYGKLAVKESLKQKYGLGDPAERQKLVDANAAAASPVAAAFAGFGAGLRGGDVTSAFNTAMNASQAKTKDALDAYDKANDQKRADFSLERDLSKAEREDKKLAEMTDPNSERSKAAQQILIEDFGMSPEVAAKMTAEQIEARIPTLKARLEREFREKEAQENRQMRKEDLETRREDRKLQAGLREDEKNKAQRIRALEAYNKDPGVRKLRERQDMADNAEALLSMDNPVADEAVGTQLARMAGEVGNLTENDIARFRGSPDLISKAKRLARRNLTGRITESDRRDLIEMVRVFREKNAESEGRMADTFSKQYGKAYGIDESELREVLTPGYKVQEKTIVRTGRTKDGRTVVEYSDGTREFR